MKRKPLPTVPNHLLDLALAGIDPNGELEPEGLFAALKKAIYERILGREIDHHLDQPGQRDAGNSRNGYSEKTVIGDTDTTTIRVPRDRRAEFEPQIIPKHQRRLAGFDDKVFALYAKGMTVRDIKRLLEELYGTEVSASLISAVTEGIMEEVQEWQKRPLEKTYAVAYFDAIQVKIRDEDGVDNRAVYMGIGIRPDGTREVLGIWVQDNEGARFWMSIMSDLRARGTEDILIAVVDGLVGFPDAIRAVFPDTTVQTCIVHLIRNSLRLLSSKDRATAAAAIKRIYKAPNAKAAEDELEAFENGPLGKKFPDIPKRWRDNWQAVVPFFAFSPEVRKILYTTNAIESLNSRVRRAVKNRGHFPNTDAAIKVVYLAVREAEKKWRRPPACWAHARMQFAIQFRGRFPVEEC